MKSFFRKLRHKSIIKHINLFNNTSILDTSCQDGTFLKVLLEKNMDKNLKVFGVDISREDIEKAKNLIPGGTFLVTYNKKLPNPDGVFDFVLTSLTLHHMDDPINSLSEMNRVLKENGRVYLVDIISRSLLSYKILNFIKCREPYHFEKFYSLLEAKSLVAKAGFKIEEVKTLSVFVMPVVILKLSKSS